MADSPDPRLPVFINQTRYLLPVGATLADAVAHVGITPPFAAAVNLQFVPRGQYREHLLQANDRVELIAPVTGG